MNGVLLGMAAGTIWLRGGSADGRLRPALWLLALDESRLEDMQALLLPVLPPLLAQHLRRLAGPAP